MATLKDVAKAANVSVSAASRILSGDSTYNARSYVAERVFAAAQALRYRPNQLARNLRLSSKDRLAVFVGARGRPASLWKDEITSHFGSVGHSKHIEVFFQSCSPEETKDEAEKMLESGQCSGVVLNIAPTRQAEVDELTQRGTALFLLDCEPQVSLNGVWVDYASATQTILQHLYKIGHRSISFISSAPLHGQQGYWHNARLAAYLRFMEESGLKPRIVMVDCGLAEAIQRVEAELLHCRPDAFLCFDDAWAQYLFHLAYKLGLRIPDDFALASFDNVPISEFLPSPLTTVGYPYNKVASILCDQFTQHIEPSLVRLTPEIFYRQSCGQNRT